MPRTFTTDQLSTIRMVGGGEKDPVRCKVIVDDRVKEWVGIGWIDVRAATDEDRRVLAVVED